MRHWLNDVHRHAALEDAIFYVTLAMQSFERLDLEAIDEVFEELQALNDDPCRPRRCTP